MKPQAVAPTRLSKPSVHDDNLVLEYYLLVVLVPVWLPGSRSHVDDFLLAPAMVPVALLWWVWIRMLR